METIVRELPTTVFVVVILFLCAMAGLALVAGLHARRHAALIEGMPTSLVSMAEDGYRELEGVVEAVDGQSLVSPLTQSPCCWYRARVEKWVARTGSTGRSDWSVVREVTSNAPFLLRDRTGACAVHPYAAEVTPTDRSVWTGAAEMPEDRNPPRTRMLESSPTMLQISGGTNSRYRYTEERIYAGDPLLAIGEFASGRFSAPALDDEDQGDAVEDVDDAADAGDAEPSAAGSADPFDDALIVDRLTDRAWRITKSTIARGRGSRPLLLTTTPQAVHVAMTTMGSQAAMSFALAPLAIAALLIWTRVK